MHTEEYRVDWVNRHDWPRSRAEAYAFQDQRREQVICAGNTREPSLIAAVEAAYGHGGETAYAAAVVFSFPELEEVDRSLAYSPARFEYIPGLFYYREGPVLVKALEGLQAKPDLVIVSGHGIAHPRRCGIASHLGLDFDTTTIGCARRLLCGTHRPLDESKGSLQSIRHREAEVGVAYRSKDGVKPIFISPGHRCDLSFARDIVVRCLRGYRLPEPLRAAHLRANKHKRYIEGKQVS